MFIFPGTIAHIPLLFKCSQVIHNDENQGRENGKSCNGIRNQNGHNDTIDKNTRKWSFRPWGGGGTLLIDGRGPAA